MKNNIQIVIEARKQSLSGTPIRRVLPFAKKRMVGPFIFLDHMGPIAFDENHAMDVLAHPHVGLSTLTYLFAGHGEHKDSLGNRQEIFAGDVNWMTAGRGIAHVERIPGPSGERRGILHGLQFWVALPEEREDMPPRFVHFSKTELPQIRRENLQISLVAGEAFEQKSPVPTESPMLFFVVRAEADEIFRFASPEDFELGLYIIEGRVHLDGRAFSDELVVFEKGSALEASVEGGSLFIVMGGRPFANPRKIWWNFVSSSEEKIARAKVDWKEHRFPEVPGESERIPLPEY